jgi:hypothetical protein
VLETQRSEPDFHRREDDAALSWLMADGRGRRFVWRLLGDAGLFRSSMAPTSEGTAFNEGRRALGLALLAAISRVCPARFAEMQQEGQRGLFDPQPSPTSGD